MLVKVVFNLLTFLKDFMKKLLIFLTFLISSNSLAGPLIKVAIIDTGLQTKYTKQIPLCNSGHKDFTGEGFNDIHGHGTNVTGLITQGITDLNYCIILIKAYSFKGKPQSYIPEALEHVVKLNVSIVNLSGGGMGSIPSEKSAILKLLSQNVTIVTAAGNESIDFNKKCDYYPACYDSRIIVVGNFSDFSNYGDIVDSTINGRNKTGFGITLSGTSQSTAIFTNRLLKELAKKTRIR